MFYLLIFIILFILACCDIDNKLNANSKNIAYAFTFFIFWLVAGLRYETGVDWPFYTEFFDRTDNIANVIGESSYLLNDPQFEIGYILLNSIVKVFTDNVQWLFLFIAFATNLMLFASLKKYSNHIFISLLIYFCSMYFVMNMDGMRQCIALNLFFMSLDFIIRKKVCYYFLLIILASLFHRPAVFLLPMYFILNMEFRNLTLLIFIGFGVFVAIFQIAWLKAIIDNIMDLNYSGHIINKLYIYSITYGSQKYGIGFIINLMIFVFCLLKRKELKTNKMFNLFLNMFALGLFLYYVVWEIGNLVNRFRLYFGVGSIVLFTYFIDIYKNRLKKYLVYAFIICYCLFYARTFLFEMPEAIAFNPYQNYVLYKVFDMQSSGLERLHKYEGFIDEK